MPPLMGVGGFMELPAAMEIGHMEYQTNREGRGPLRFTKVSATHTLRNRLEARQYGMRIANKAKAGALRR